MNPFTAWMATNEAGSPVKTFGKMYPSGMYSIFAHQSAARVIAIAPLRVLIVPDTEENRKKLGMEE